MRGTFGIGEEVGGDNGGPIRAHSHIWRMPFLDDPLSATFALLASSRERIRLSRLYSESLRRAHDETMDSIFRSRDTIRRNELSMTPELKLLIRQKPVNDDSSAGGVNSCA